MKYRTFVMENVLDSIIDYRGKTPKKSENGIKTLSAKSVRDGYIDYSQCYYISKEEYDRFMVRGFPKVGDVLMTTEAPLGVLARLDRDDIALAQRLITLRGKENVLDTGYLYYYLRSPVGQGKIKERQTGTTVTGIKQAEFRKIEIALSSIDIQRKVASLLGVLDEKILVNKKINDNLLQQAQAIFKHWFTDNPNLDDMKQVPLAELCLVVTKGTTPTTLGKPFVTEGINFIKVESILDNHTFDQNKFAFIDSETNNLLKRSIINSGDIIFTIAGTLGRFALIDDSVLPANTNQAVAIIRANQNKVTPDYLYSFFLGNWHNDYYRKRIQQAVQANLNLGTIKSLPIPILPDKAMSEYLGILSPIITMTKANELEITKLRAIRDTLLPKLMSGQVDVSAIEL